MKNKFNKILMIKKVKIKMIKFNIKNNNQTKRIQIKSNKLSKKLNNKQNKKMNNQIKMNN